MRIIGLIVLGLMLLNGLVRTVMIAISLASGAGSNAAPGYVASYLLGTLAITAIIGYFFMRLLKKTE